MYVNPGDLNKKIKIIRKYSGRHYDSLGHPIVDEEVVRECWAKVSSVSGTELIKAGQELTDTRKRFLVRWTPTEITEAMVVRYKGDDLGIVRVNTYSDNKDYMEIWTDTKKAVV